MRPRLIPYLFRPVFRFEYMFEKMIDFILWKCYSSAWEQKHWVLVWCAALGISPGSFPENCFSIDEKGEDLRHGNGLR